MEEDKTLNEEGLEDKEESYVEDNTSETKEADETEEEQTEQTGDARKERASNQISRLKAEKDKLKEKLAYLESIEGSEKSPTKERKEVSNTDDNNRLRLEMKGIEDTNQQDFVMKYAKMEGMSIAEALNDDVVSAKLEKLSGEQEKSRATNSPINRTGKPREKTGAELAKDLETKGTMPSTKEGRRLAIKALQDKYGRT